MLNNIQSALERLGLSAQKRAIHVQFSNSALNAQLFLQRIDGEHALNKGLTAELICLSTDATIPLKQFILHYPDGEPVKNLKYKVTAADGQVFEFAVYQVKMERLKFVIKML